MESYLVRIYRRDEDNPEGITGTVEEIGVERRQTFKGLAELAGIITKGQRGGHVEAKAIPWKKTR